MNTLIVIPFIDEAQMTLDCIKAIRKNSTGAYLQIVSDGSKFGNIIKIVNAVYDESDIIIIENDERKGLAYCWNMGMTLFKTRDDLDYICFVHNDILPVDGWLTEMRLAFDVNNNVGVVFPSQGLRSGRYAILETDADCVPGYCFMMHRTVVEQFGKFNVSFEVKPELEYFSRMKGHNLQFIEARRAFVEHKGGVTTSKLWSVADYAKKVYELKKKIGL